MASLSLDTLRRDGEAFMQEISREVYLSHAGHKQTAELQPIYARHAAIVSAERVREYIRERIEP